jgi:hypothetical protein
MKAKRTTVHPSLAKGSFIAKMGNIDIMVLIIFPLGEHNA